MKSSNLFAGFVVVIGITLVGYIGLYKINWDEETGTGDSKQASDTTDREIFSYVPADTLFFFGGLTTMSFRETIDAMNPGNTWMQNGNWSNQLSEEEKAQLPAAALMIAGLTNKYMELIKTPDTAASMLGIGENLDAVSYSVGVIPVLRFRLNNPVAFKTLIEDVEKQNKITATMSSAGNIKLRSYSLDIDGEPNPSYAKFIIGFDDHYAIFSLATKIESENAHNMIVGASKPANSLNAIKTLGAIKNKYNFHPAYIGFINHIEIMKGLSGEGNGEFGKMLDTVIDMAGKASANTAPRESNGPATMPNTEHDTNPLDAIRTDACRKELLAMVDAWPQTVFGYTKMELRTKPKLLEARMIIEGTDVTFMKEMQAIRGYIPAVLQSVDEHLAFGFGLGINVDGLSPFVAKTTQGFTSKQYQCDFLKIAKQNLMQSNPAMALSLMSGMAAGVQGVSISVLDLEGNLENLQPGAVPELKRIDAIITVSSKNPQQLLTMASTFMPDMPPLQLPADGSPVDFPVPMPVPALAKLKLALKGNHLVAYVGEKARVIADKLGNEPIRASGLFAINMDFGKYMGLLSQAARSGISAGADEKAAQLSDQDKAMLEAMAKTKMQFVETLDIENEGIAFDIKMETD